MLLALTAVPVMISVLLGVITPRVGRRLPPATAVKVLAPTSVAVALATGFCLSVLAFNAVANLGVIARFAHWSPIIDPDDGTPPAAAGVVLALLVTGLVVAATNHLVRTVTEVIRTGWACRQLMSTTDQIVVVDDDVADAFAIAGPGGRIVVTSAMLSALDRPERAVLIAHERSHLAHHHQLLVHLAGLAASANPLLLPVAAQVRVLTERWADEDAAATVRDRDLAARAVAKAALARTSSARLARTRPAAPLGAATTGVTERVRALARPQPRPHRRLTAALAGLALTGLIASGWIAHSTENKFEHIQASVAGGSLGEG